MNVTFVISYNLIALFIYFLGTVWIGHVLLKKLSLGQRRCGPLRILLFLSAALFYAVTGVVFLRMGLFASVIGNICSSYLAILINALLVRIIFGEDLPICWSISIFTYAVHTFASSLSMSFSSREIFHLKVFRQLMEYLLFNLTSVVIFALLVFLLYKMKIGDAFGQWMENKGIWTVGMIFLNIHPVLCQELSWWFRHKGMSNTGSELPSMMIIIAVLFIFHYMGMDELQKKAAAAQRLSIQQQNAYIGTLEGMQEEMRRFRHDYKNMMAGMYLQAKEGNLSEITEFIQKMTDDFEDQVGGQIQKMTQLRNVCIMEVRGILLVKFMEMEQEGISCELEVIAPLQEANIKTTDLCRCLGILIDNAIDEVRGHDGAPDHSKRQSAGNGSGKVHVMISRQEDCVTIRVKNTLYHEIDLSKIWESGYSTKGKERGIGLASYKRILDGYDNILSAASVQDGEFIQEMKIMEAGGAYIAAPPGK